MNWKRNRLASIIAVLLAVMIIAGNISGVAIAKSEIRLNTKNVTLQTGKTKKLSLLGISKKNSKKIVWHSSKKSVVSVSKKGKQFVKSLPQTISMQRIGNGREFYGDLDSELDYNKKDSQTTFKNGDIAYWYSGNGLCLLYNNQVKNPEIKSGIIVFGKITSDLSIFYDLDDDIEVKISLAK